MTDPSPKSISIDIGDPVVSGVYSNMVISSTTQDEITLDFLYLLPHTQKAKVQSRVILSPNQAKRLAALLTANIKDYEHQFGPILDAPHPPGIQISPN